MFKKTKSLDLIISTEDIQMDPLKVSAILDWTQQITFRHVRSFRGFCNFYQRFIQNFFKLAKHFTGLTKKDILFN